MRLFKRQAPNDMKKGDLIAKWWIITDPERGLMRGTRDRTGKPLLLSIFPPQRHEMHEAALILYSQKLYGV
jgi:hypothetical protein